MIYIKLDQLSIIMRFFFILLYFWKAVFGFRTHKFKQSSILCCIIYIVAANPMEGPMLLENLRVFYTVILMYIRTSVWENWVYL